MKHSIIKIIALLIVSGPFLSCEADDVTTPPPMLCDNAQIYALSTTDPYSGLSNLDTDAANESLSWSASATIVPGGLGTAISNSGTSTYNFDNESYHYYNYQSSEFININASATFNNVTLSGSPMNWNFNGITYVSGLAKYFILGVDVSGTISNGTIGLFEILNIDTGVIASSPIVTITSYSVPTGMENLFLEFISIATDNNDKVYAVSQSDIFSFDLSSGTSLHAVLPPATSGVGLTYLGLEYNNNWNTLVAISYSYSGPELKLVEINPLLLTLTNASIDLNSSIPNFYTDYYSTTLSCDEGRYFISTRSANIDTNFYTIDINSGILGIALGSIITTNVSGNYYFGLESNGNN